MQTLKSYTVQINQEMHDLKEGASMLQHRPGTLPPPMLTHIKEESPSAFFYTHSNPMDNAAAAAAAAAAAGLIDPHSRELHNALVATINNNVAAVNGTLTSAAVAAHTQQLKSHQHQQQHQANNSAQQVAASQQQQQKNVVAQQSQAALSMLNGSNAVVAVATKGANSNTNSNNNNSSSNAAMNGTVAKSSSSGRSTPNNNSINGGNAADPAPGKLFVGGLSWQTSSEKLKEYFNMFGTVTDVLIMKDPVTQRSRGFGFITFQEPNSVDKVLQVPIHTLDGKKIDPKHATPKNRPRQANKTKKIFVGGVSQDTSADEVKAYFNQFGTVEETVMLMDQQTKRHRGFGFVTFENEDIVDRVCDIHFHTIKNKKVECKKAQPKEAVTPATAATQLLQKRIMLSTLGMPLPTAPAQLLGARGQLAGVPTTVNQQIALLQTQQLQFQTPGAAAQQAALITHPNPFQVQNANAAAAAAAMAANGGGFGKLLTGYPQAALHSMRYAPYPIPASALAVAQHQQHQHQQHAVAAHAAVAAQQQHQHQHQPHQQQTHAHSHSHSHSSTQSHATAASNQSAAAAAAAAAATQAHNAALAVAGGNAAHAGVAGAAAGQHSLAAAAAAQQAALVASNPLQAAGNPYQSYTLANVDMSSFQSVDWGAMYGMGMYV